MKNYYQTSFSIEVGGVISIMVEICKLLGISFNETELEKVVNSGYSSNKAHEKYCIFRCKNDYSKFVAVNALPRYDHVHIIIRLTKKEYQEIEVGFYEIMFKFKEEYSMSRVEWGTFANQFDYEVINSYEYLLERILRETEPHSKLNYFDNGESYEDEEGYNEEE